ncbi:MAG: hypothetical protein ABIN04_01505 [Ginsengibacter sp.]
MRIIKTNKLIDDFILDEIDLPKANPNEELETISKTLAIVSVSRSTIISISQNRSNIL